MDGRRGWQALVLPIIGVSLLFVGVLQEFCRHTLSVDSRSHKIMALIAEYANDLSRQRIVQDFDHSLPVGGITFGYRTPLDVLAGALAKRLDVSQKWFISHGVTP